MQGNERVTCESSAKPFGWLGKGLEGDDAGGGKTVASGERKLASICANINHSGEVE